MSLFLSLLSSLVSSPLSVFRFWCIVDIDYVFKDYNADTHWKMYQGWVAVRHLPKFSFENNAPPKCMVKSGLTETEEGWSSGVEFV